MNKKKFIIILLVIVLIVKLFQIIFLQEIKINIENFEKLDNSYCKQILDSLKDKIVIIRISKNKIINETVKFKNIEETNRFVDINKKQEIIINNNKIYEIKTNKNNPEIKIENLPKCLKVHSDVIENLKEGNIFAIFYYFKILYIIPAKYNNIDCYKIRTTREILYVDKENLYPVYLEYKQNNSNEKKEKVTVEYIFKENTVTDEDIKIPDLNNYILDEN